MLSVSSSTMARSSLEEMLDSLRKRDEKPKDMPPALPARPTSRSMRLPSTRRSLPVDFKVGGVNAGLDSPVGEDEGKEDGKRKERELGFRKGGLGSRKRIKALQPGDLPYVDAVEVKALVSTLTSPRSTLTSPRSTHTSPRSALTSPRSTLTSPRSRKDMETDDNIGYFIKKVIEHPQSFTYCCLVVFCSVSKFLVFPEKYLCSLKVCLAFQFLLEDLTFNGFEKKTWNFILMKNCTQSRLVFAENRVSASFSIDFSEFTA